MAIEIPCTLRCDTCKETQSAIMPTRAHYVPHSYPIQCRSLATFVLAESDLPPGWTLTQGPTDKLRCPRCSGAK